MFAGGCTTTFSTFYVKPTQVQRIDAGDTMGQVEEKLGQPKDVWPVVINQEGREQTVWAYDTGAAAQISWTGTIQPSPHTPISLAREHQVRPLNDAGYLVVFVDGRVSEIVRQE